MAHMHGEGTGSWTPLGSPPLLSGVSPADEQLPLNHVDDLGGCWLNGSLLPGLNVLIRKLEMRNTQTTDVQSLSSPT